MNLLKRIFLLPAVLLAVEMTAAAAQAAPCKVIVVSCLGFQDKEVKVAGQKEIVITMEAQANMLDEVVSSPLCRQPMPCRAGFPVCRCFRTME